MTIEQGAALAEIVGAVAVVISLIYVGVQIRQNTISQNALIEKATNDIHSLSNEELRQLRFTYFGFFNIWHIAYKNHHRGMLEKQVLEEWERGAAWMLTTDLPHERYGMICPRYTSLHSGTT